jgi:alcohol dehydrogenase class IV
MPELRFDTTRLPPIVISGPASRRAINAEARALGLQRLFLVCSPGLRRSTPFVDELAGALGGRLVGVHDSIAAHNPDDQLARPAAVAREAKADCIVSLGGGLAHDIAKALAVMAPSGRGILDFVPDSSGRLSPSAVAARPLPVFTVPSTFSAAEVIGGGAVTDTARREKVLFFHPHLTPRRVFLDGDVVATTPLAILAASGLNAVHHCLEALYAKGHHPVSDALAVAALTELVDILPRLAPDAGTPAVAIFQRAVDASSVSGLTYANASLGVGHAICHSLGGRFGLSHSVANAVILRHSLRFNAGAARAPLARAGRVVCGPAASDETAVESLIVRVDNLCDRLGTPKRLRDIGLPAGSFEAIARDVMADSLTSSNPRPVAPADVIGILEAAW